MQGSFQKKLVEKWMGSDMTWSLLLPRKRNDMKTKTGKNLILYLTAVLLMLYLFPIFAAAAGEEGTVSFSTFDELKEHCAQLSAGQPGASLLCTEEDFVITEDFEIPSGMVITFRNFTVPEGITLTVAEQAEVMTYAVTVQGELINRGKFIQQDLNASWADENDETTARISGKVFNSGEMVLTDVFGKRNIRQRGGQYTMYETDSYQSKLDIAIGKTPAPSSTVEVTATPAPPNTENRRPAEFFDLREYLLPMLTVFIILIAFFAVVKTGVSLFIQRKPGNDRPEDTVFDYSGEDHFQRDKRSRIEQLDEWLKNGLIDRKEYNELKRRYRDEG